MLVPLLVPLFVSLRGCMLLAVAMPVRMTMAGRSFFRTMLVLMGADEEVVMVQGCVAAHVHVVAGQQMLDPQPPRCRKQQDRDPAEHQRTGSPPLDEPLATAARRSPTGLQRGAGLH